MRVYRSLTFQFKVQVKVDKRLLRLYHIVARFMNVKNGIFSDNNGLPLYTKWLDLSVVIKVARIRRKLTSLLDTRQSVSFFWLYCFGLYQLTRKLEKKRRELTRYWRNWYERLYLKKIMSQKISWIFLNRCDYLQSETHVHLACIISNRGTALGDLYFEKNEKERKSIILTFEILPLIVQ